MTLRLADVLASIHHRGGCHGHIGPDAVVLSGGEAFEPVLTFGTNDPAQECYRRRYPAVSVNPTQQQDVWALGALLFEMLSRQELAVTDSGCVTCIASAHQDHEMTQLLERVLAPVGKWEELQAFRRDLSRWYVRRAATAEAFRVDRERSAPLTAASWGIRSEHPGGLDALASPMARAPDETEVPLPRKGSSKARRLLGNSALVLGVLGGFASGVWGAWCMASFHSEYPRMASLPEIVRSLQRTLTGERGGGRRNDRSLGSREFASAGERPAEVVSLVRIVVPASSVDMASVAAGGLPLPKRHK